MRPGAVVRPPRVGSTVRDQFGPESHQSVEKRRWSTAPRRRSASPQTCPRSLPEHPSSCENTPASSHGGSRATAPCRLTWNGSWTQFMPRFVRGNGLIGQVAQMRRVITAGQSVVPPAGFEPALPPPETGRCRDRGRLLATYLGFLFASCVSGDLRCAVVRSTGHSTASVLIGRTGRAPVLRKISVVLAGRLAGLVQLRGQPAARPTQSRDRSLQLARGC